MAKYKFTRGATADLASNAPLTDGQILYDTTEDQLAFDVASNNVVTRRWLTPKSITETYVRSLFSDDLVITAPTRADFPVEGDPTKIYIDLSTDKVYRWESGTYVEYDYGIHSPASYGIGYGTCSTAEVTTAKEVVLDGYSLVTHGIVAVKFTNAVPAASTMNVNSQGAKAMFYKGSAIVDDVIKAGDIATFVYDGTQYQLIALDSPSASNVELLSTTLAAGSTSVTFTNLPTTGINLFNVYTSKPGLDYVDMTSLSNETLTITYEPQSSAVTVYLKIERF